MKKRKKYPFKRITFSGWYYPFIMVTMLASIIYFHWMIIWGVIIFVAIIITLSYLRNGDFPILNDLTRIIAVPSFFLMVVTALSAGVYGIKYLATNFHEWGYALVLISTS